MKILEAQSATLSNPEVLSHLTFLQTRRQNTKPPNAATPLLKSPNYETVIKELTDYLSPSASEQSPLPPYSPPAYTPAKIKNLIVRLKGYNLTKAELLMITNLKPEDLGFLDCVVEECDLRFSAEEQEEILRVVGECIGGQGMDVDVDGEDGVNEEGKENGKGEEAQAGEMNVDGDKSTEGQG
ncbi:hypothetical protein MMC30_002003 [Trapelia coarctata]|nr:hypothetical protein [Trapelia coarctata]